MNEDIIIPLPALIHRIGREEVNKAKDIAQQYQCVLKRIRRSRNWQLSGEAIKIESYSAQLKTKNSGGFCYLIQKIAIVLLENADKLEPVEIMLVRLIIDNPNITLAKLMLSTDCTLAEARTARLQGDL